jgi:enoyl-CoA hydratase/carnithine racemase
MTETFADGGLTLTPGVIATVTLAAPATRNAMTRAMWAALPEIVARIEADASIRAVIVTGAGGSFCAGADISEFETVYGTEAAARVYNGLVRAGQQALRDLDRPVIAAIEGACVGGGCGIALSCDLRFAAEGAIFAITPARLGIAYSPADTMALVEKVGPARAKDILFSARKLDTAEALSIGLIERVVPGGTALATARSYAEELAALSPASLAVTKRIVNGLIPLAADPALTQAFEALFTGADFAEGTRAFLDRRRPRFPDRG